MPPLPQHETTRRQLSQEVATYVRELIISGRVRKGNFLRIESISKAMDISSTPVREGLLLLQLEGFVKLSPRRGFMVVGLQPSGRARHFLGPGHAGRRARGARGQGHHRG